jgi:hypothetical protein
MTEMETILATVERMIKKLDSDEWKATMIATIEALTKGLGIVNQRIEEIETRLNTRFAFDW